MIDKISYYFLYEDSFKIQYVANQFHITKIVTLFGFGVKETFHRIFKNVVSHNCSNIKDLSI